MFLRVGSVVVHPDEVSEVDFSEVESLRAVLVLRGGRVLRAYGNDVIDLAMLLRPSVLEGRRMRWPRRAWAFHNLVAHPAMQLLALVGMPALGVRLHDATVPRPSGAR